MSTIKKQWNIKNDKIKSVPELVTFYNLDTCKKHYDPYDFLYMFDAVYAIKNAVCNYDVITIFGDFDVDGICSTIMLYDFLKRMGAVVNYIIPDRLVDGYGLKDSAVPKILDLGTKLLITVDNGISAVSAVKALNEKGVLTVITDHHLCPDILPDAEAIINPHQENDDYPFKDICGAVVVYKLIQAVCMELNLPDSDYEKYRDFITLATIGDVMPLIDENRLIVKTGLESMKSACNTGLYALIQSISKISFETLTAQDIAYYICPCINAASRMGSIDLILDLFMESSISKAKCLVNDIIKINENRKETSMQILQGCQAQIIATDLSSSSPIFLSGLNLYRGVIGVVAGNVCSEYNRPVFIFSEEDGILKGSCRSIKGINIMDAINSAKDLLISYGGHAGAAGLNLKKENYTKFKTAITKYFEKNVHPSSYKSYIDIECELTPAELTFKNYKLIKELEPFGEENPTPLFVMRDVSIHNIKSLKNGLYMKFCAFKDNLSFPCISFNMPMISKSLVGAKSVDLVFKISTEKKGESNQIQLDIVDIRTDSINSPIGKAEDELYSANVLSLKEISEKTSIPKEKLIPLKEDYSIVFKSLQDYYIALKYICIYSDVDYLTCVINNLNKTSKEKINSFKLLRLLRIFADLNYIFFQNFSDNNVVICFNGNNSIKKKNIYDSAEFRKMIGRDTSV